MSYSFKSFGEAQPLSENGKKLWTAQYKEIEAIARNKSISLNSRKQRVEALRAQLSSVPPGIRWEGSWWGGYWGWKEIWDKVVDLRAQVYNEEGRAAATPTALSPAKEAIKEFFSVGQPAPPATQPVVQQPVKITQPQPAPQPAPQPIAQPVQAQPTPQTQSIRSAPQPLPQPLPQAQPKGTSFIDIISGLTSIVNPLATAGAGAFQTQQQAELSKLLLKPRTAQTPDYSSLFQPTVQKNNTLLIVGVAGGLVLVLVVVLALS